MLVEKLFHLQAGNILAAADDDVLGAILDLHVTVGMLNGQVSGVKPITAEGLMGGVVVLQIAFHDGISTQHQLAHGGTVPGHRRHALTVRHHDFLQRVIGDTLARHHPGAGIHAQITPLALPGAQDGGPVGFGEAVEVGDAKTQLFHGRDYFARWRGAAGGDLYGVIATHPLLRGRVHQHVEHHRRTAHVGDGVLLDHGEYHRRINLAQAHMGAGGGGHGPGVGPAVAVKHGQRPEVDALVAEAERQDLAHGIQVGTPVVVDDALGSTRGAGGVTEADGLPLVRRVVVGVVARAFQEQGLVAFLSHRGAALAGRVIDVDDHRRIVHARDCRGDGVGKLPIRDQQFRLRMVENEGNRACIETVVQRVEHRARHGHAIVALEHCGHIRRHDGNSVA